MSDICCLSSSFALLVSFSIFVEADAIIFSASASALDDALQRGVEEIKLRPFLQGFWHSDAEVQENIRAAEDKNLDWIIWNVSSSYNLGYFSKLDS